MRAVRTWRRPTPQVTKQLLGEVERAAELRRGALARVLSGYRLGAPIAHGSRGLIVRADREHGRFVAKIPAPPGPSSEPFEQCVRAIAYERRFLALASGVPGVVEVARIVQAGDIVCLVLPRHGPSLRRLLDRNEPADIPSLVRDLVGAVAGLAQRGLMHNDINPSNVLRTEGGWTLIDPSEHYGTEHYSDEDLDPPEERDVLGAARTIAVTASRTHPLKMRATQWRCAAQLLADHGSEADVVGRMQRALVAIADEVEAETS